MQQMPNPPQADFSSLAQGWSESDEETSACALLCN